MTSVVMRAAKLSSLIICFACGTASAECVGDFTSVKRLSSSKYVYSSGASSVSVSALEGGIYEISADLAEKTNSSIECQHEAASTAEIKETSAVFDKNGAFTSSINEKGKSKPEPAKKISFSSAKGDTLIGIDAICRDADGKIKIVFNTSKNESYYGLGEPLTPEEGLLPLDYAGRKRVAWNKHWPPADLPVNFFFTRRGYGVFIDNFSKAEWDMTKPGEAVWSSDGGRIRFFIIQDATPAGILSKYMHLTGMPPLPPMWTLGFMQSKYGYRDAQEFQSVMDGLRSRNIPADTIIFDIDWQGVGGMGNLEWNEQTFPDSKGFLNRMETNGFKTMVIVEPYMWTNTKYYMEGRKRKIFTKDDKGRIYGFTLWGRPGSQLDFCNPKTTVFWKETVARLHDTGIDGWWTDLNEPDIDAEDNYYYDKTACSLAHNVQPLKMIQSIDEAFKEKFPDERHFIFSRSGSAGVGKYAAVWSGDLTSSFQHLMNQIPVGVNAGYSGMPVWGTDMGGFNGHPTPEMMVRWLQFGLFNPVFRAHGNHDPREPWAYGDEAERIMKKTIELRYRLLPHLYTVLRSMHDTGLPPMRSLFLNFPSDEKSWSVNTEYMFGDSILTAPVVREGETAKSVYFPPGGWFDFNTGKKYSGPSMVDISAPLDTLPFFIREGSIIAMGPVVQHTGALKRDEIEFHVYPGAKKTTYKLYEDDGKSNGYLKGVYATTEVVADGCASKKCKVSVMKTKGGFEGLPQKRNWTVVLHGVAAKSADVKIDGKKIGKSGAVSTGASWAFAENGSLRISVPERQSGFVIDVALK